MPGPVPLVRWTLYDPVVPETYTVEVNPNAGGSPKFAKSITTRSTASPAGRTLVFEGRDEPKSYEVQGSILTQEHLEALQAWMTKRRQIMVTDDLGRQFWVYLERFEPVRVRKASNPWYHTYTLTYLELDIP